MNENILSIIIPVYNLEDYLEDSLKYILDYNDNKDIEIILVNDGSKDNTDMICKKYVKMYTNIKYIYQKNKGVSSARNNGLDVSNGKYIWFVDGDDIVLPNSISIIKEAIKSFDYPDVIVGRYLNFYLTDDLNKINEDNKNYNLKIVKKDDMLKSYIFIPALWRNIFKKELFIKNKIRINENLKYTEDMDCTLNLLLNSENIILLDKNIYGYRKKRNSSATKNISKKRVSDNFYFVKVWLNFLNNRELSDSLKKDLEEFIKYEYAIVVGMLFLLPKEDRKDFFKEIEDLKFLMIGSKSKKGKVVEVCYKIFGFYITGKLMSYWIKYRN